MGCEDEEKRRRGEEGGGVEGRSGGEEWRGGSEEREVLIDICLMLPQLKVVTIQLYFHYGEHSVILTGGIYSDVKLRAEGSTDMSFQ